MSYLHQLFLGTVAVPVLGLEEVIMVIIEAIEKEMIEVITAVLVLVTPEEAVQQRLDTKQHQG